DPLSPRIACTPPRSAAKDAPLSATPPPNRLRTPDMVRYATRDTPHPWRCDRRRDWLARRRPPGRSLLASPLASVRASGRGPLEVRQHFFFRQPTVQGVAVGIVLEGVPNLFEVLRGDGVRDRDKQRVAP